MEREGAYTELRDKVDVQEIEHLFALITRMNLPIQFINMTAIIFYRLIRIKDKKSFEDLVVYYCTSLFMAGKFLSLPVSIDFMVHEARLYFETLLADFNHRNSVTKQKNDEFNLDTIEISVKNNKNFQKTKVDNELKESLHKAVINKKSRKTSNSHISSNSNYQSPGSVTKPTHSDLKYAKTKLDKNDDVDSQTNEKCAKYDTTYSLNFNVKRNSKQNNINIVGIENKTSLPQIINISHDNSKKTSMDALIKSEEFQNLQKRRKFDACERTSNLKFHDFEHFRYKNDLSQTESKENAMLHSFLSIIDIKVFENQAQLVENILDLESYLCITTKFDVDFIDIYDLAEEMLINGVIERQYQHRFMAFCRDSAYIPLSQFFSEKTIVKSCHFLTNSLEYVQDKIPKDRDIFFVANEILNMYLIFNNR